MTSVYSDIHYSIARCRHRCASFLHGWIGLSAELTRALLGCAYNAPSKYTVGDGTKPGEFESCESDNMRELIGGVARGSELNLANPQAFLESTLSMGKP